MNSLPALDTEGILRKITHAAASLTGASVANFWLTDAANGTLTPSASGFGNDVLDPLPETVRCGEGFVEWIAEHRQQLHVAEASEDSRNRHPEWWRRHGLRSFLGLPVTWDDKPLAVLALAARGPLHLSPDVLSILDGFVAQAAVTIQNASLFTEAARRRQETEDLLRALRESQEQLFQSQKVEALGRLAGGIAHDFNNLLTVIKGRAEMLFRSLLPEGPARRNAELILATTERAETVLRRLLTFGRRHPHQQKLLDINAVITGMTEMLRLVGEPVELVSVLDPSVVVIRGDSALLEQTLVNLVLNARDAMPKGGRVTIETLAVERQPPALPCGPCVVLRVRDTGVGMEPETRARIFEPFFTTKTPEKGAGLGLSVVYGIVKQHGGEITVETTPGHGSVFSMWFPRVTEPAEILLVTRPSSSTDLLGGDETVLLVEDEAAVLDFVREVLRELGYVVLCAADGSAAIELAAQHEGPIHLLVTDVVLGSVSGPEVAQRLRRFRPRTRVLYISGYPDTTLAEQGVVDSQTALLRKPFTSAELARAVRETLEMVGPSPHGDARQLDHA